MKPRLCIIDNNTLAAIGLKQLLQQVMPIAEVDYFGSITELEANHPEQYAHYFASMSIVLEHRAFFSDKSRKTIVLTTVSSAFGRPHSPILSSGPMTITERAE